MAHILVDRVKETTTTTGAGTLALLGAVSQFRAFSAVMANNDTTLYAIVGQTGTEWEVGVGTWTTGNNLARTTILASSNAGSVVTLSGGTKNVFMTLTLLGEWPGIKVSAAPAGRGVAWNANEMAIVRSAANTLEILTASLLLEIPVAGRAPLLFNPAGTLNVSSDGAMGMDATNLYATTDAGNPGIIPVVNFIRANAVRTYTSNTSAQAIFNSPANGRLTVEAGTYRFHGVLSFSAMSATSGNRSFNILGAGTAVTTGIVYAIGGADTAVATNAAGGFSHNVAVASPTSAVPATVAVGAIFVIDGSLEVTTAGTLIPSTTMVTAAASTMAIGSFLEIWRTGTDAVVSVGQWD